MDIERLVAFKKGLDSQTEGTKEYPDITLGEFIIFGILDEISSKPTLWQALEQMSDQDLIVTLEWWEFIIKDGLIVYHYKQQDGISKETESTINEKTLTRLKIQLDPQTEDLEEYPDTTISEYIIFGIYKDMFSVPTIRQALEQIPDEDLLETMRFWEFTIQNGLNEYGYVQQEDISQGVLEP